MNARDLARAGCGLIVATAALCSVQCASSPRFALRPPITRDDDARPIARAPATTEALFFAGGVDYEVLRPAVGAFAFRRAEPAVNVNAMDEVPDSTWFTNRSPTPAESARGPCVGSPAQAPFAVLHVKSDGTTPGLIVRDALGRRFMLKVDQFAADRPETATAADVIGSRLWWSIGYNVPCNEIAYVQPSSVTLAPGAFEVDDVGARRPLRMHRVLELLADAVHRPDGAARVSTSLFVEGEPLGPFPPTGTRPDDPNDTIPHEDRRELRGERLLAAWTNRWDAREYNSLDTFVRAPGGGYVVHYMIDFSDILGGRVHSPEGTRRLGYTTFMDLSVIAVDTIGFGLLRRPWDNPRVDPRAPNLGYFEAEHFDPDDWRPVLLQPRYRHARDEDLAWMSRKIARITPEHLSAIIAEGRFSSASTVARATEVLLARRARILQTWFRRRSPLTDFVVERGTRLCALDLGITTGMNTPDQVHYATDWHQGATLGPGPSVPLIERTASTGALCATLPPHFAPANARDDAPERYAVLDIYRSEGRANTQLRAHFYDLGPARGYVLVGIERP